MKGHLHVGEPKGTIERLADIETYVVEPPSGKANGHVILYVDLADLMCFLLFKLYHRPDVSAASVKHAQLTARPRYYPDVFGFFTYVLRCHPTSRRDTDGLTRP